MRANNWILNTSAGRKVEYAKKLEIVRCFLFFAMRARAPVDPRHGGGLASAYSCLLVCWFACLFVCSPDRLPKTHIVGKTSSGIDVAKGAGKGRKVAFPHWHLSLHFFSSKVTPCDFGVRKKTPSEKSQRLCRWS